VRPILFRTFVSLAYLGALLLHGRWDARTALLALAVVAVWTVAAVRDTVLARRHVLSH
jgi:ABC-type uncharacterized transport system permease subunit